MTKYFVQCPDCGFEEFDTIELRDNAASACIVHHLDETWSEEVTGVVSGVIEERATQCDLIQRPEKLDDEGVDDTGRSWHPDWSHFCDYSMSPEPNNKV